MMWRLPVPDSTLPTCRTVSSSAAEGAEYERPEGQGPSGVGLAVVVVVVVGVVVVVVDVVVVDVVVKCGVLSVGLWFGSSRIMRVCLLLLASWISLLVPPIVAESPHRHSHVPALRSLMQW